MIKGYRVSRVDGQKKVIIYTNIITKAEKKLVKDYYIAAGYDVELAIRDVEKIKARSAKSGFSSPAATATKQELLAWIDKNDPDAADYWHKAFSPKSAGGKGFALAKSEFRKIYPEYPVAASKLRIK